MTIQQLINDLQNAIDVHHFDSHLLRNRSIKYVRIN